MTLLRLLAKLLLVYAVISLAELNTYPFCLKGERAPIIVVRENPINGFYSLAKKIWTLYPDLSDKFYLKTPQRVRIFYTVTALAKYSCAFETSLYINGKRQRQFSFYSHNNVMMTHSMQDIIWLQKGEYNIAVWYFTTGDFWNQPPNSNGGFQYGLLKIEYLQF